MKRLLLLTILIGLLFTSPNSFAQSSKPKRATIKYGNGVKYVGEIRKVSPKGFIIRKMKFKHGTGIMYFANGDQLNGEWCYDQCKRGTYKFAYGDIFEGEISESSIQNGKMIFSSGLGTMIFASEGDITLGYKIWHYPANCSFTGTIKDKKPYTGTFDCTLTTKDGDVLLEGYPTDTSGTVKSNIPMATRSREISYPTPRQAANIATEASRK